VLLSGRSWHEANCRSGVNRPHEGNFGGVHTAYYDLFRFANSKIVEHWDTTESIASREEWKNHNGKF
jgi:predicted SnoaL-like aldol condensation-catalyzing enzyme